MRFVLGLKFMYSLKVTIMYITKGKSIYHFNAYRWTKIYWICCSDAWQPIQKQTWFSKIETKTAMTIH